MLGALIGAGSSLLGGLLGKSSADKQNAQQMKLARENIALQKQFARKSIQWKTQDAKKAGIHPLYALGAQGYQFSPVSVGSVGDPLGSAIADAGQNIGRAVESGMSSDQRMAGRLGALQVQRAELENTKLASEIALMQQAGQPPPHHTPGTVIPGQGNGVRTVPHEVVSTIGEPSITAGAPAETSLYASRNGYAPSMSETYAEGAGEGVMGQVSWGLRNYVPAILGKYHKGLPDPGPGKMWVFNPISLEYVKTGIPNYNLRRK